MPVLRTVISTMCLLFAASVFAQSGNDGTAIRNETMVTGEINSAVPRAVYHFDGTRGEVIRLQLSATSGTLDPVLSVYDAGRNVILSRDDDRGQRNIDVELTLNRNGRFFIAVGRFGYALGTTQGDYELLMRRIGITSEQGSTLQYGLPVTNAITSMQPQLYYTFRAERGDIVNIDMVRSSGNLDPYLQVVDRNQFLIAYNDDAVGGTSRNARIDNLLIEETGTYIIVASRYGLAGGDSVGSFVLTVTEASNSGLGNSRQAPRPLLYGQPVEGDISDDQPERYYQIDVQRDDIITISMDRTGGGLDPYLVLTNAGFMPLVEDDDSGSGRNALIQQVRIPADGTYYIIARRYEGEDGGGTVGRYRLNVTYEGTAFDDVPPSVPRLLYGTSVRDAITPDDEDSLFAFWGAAGDLVNVAMNRAGGDVDAFVELLDSQQVRIVFDDDSGSGENAIIQRFTLPYTGVYYIRATAYAGAAKPSPTYGDFNLTLSQALP